MVVHLLPSILKLYQKHSKGNFILHFLAPGQLQCQVLEGSLQLRELLIWTELFFLVTLLLLRA